MYQETQLDKLTSGESLKTNEETAWWENDPGLYDHLVFLLRYHIYRKQASKAKERKMTKRKRKQQIGSAQNKRSNIGPITVKEIKPLTTAQEDTFDAYDEDYNLVLTGPAGTGKTFVALYLALKSIIDYQTHQRVIIVRSTVPARDPGFLPGDLNDKQKPYEDPYVQICNELGGRGDFYEILTKRGVLQFMSTAFLRGLSLPGSIVIVDEFQNMSFGELDTIITRLSKNSKIIFCGDDSQTDLERVYYRETSGYREFLDILDRMVDEFDFVEFGVEDIVRHKLVKAYIKSRMEMTGRARRSFNGEY